MTMGVDDPEEVLKQDMDLNLMEVENSNFEESAWLERVIWLMWTTLNPMTWKK